MIKIYLSELKNLKKDIFLYLIVLSILYSMIIALVSFAKVALDDIDKTIKDNTKGIDFEIKISDPDSKLKKYLVKNDCQDILYVYLQENNIISAPTINDYSRNNSLRGRIFCKSPKNISINYNIDETDIPDDCIMFSDQIADYLKVSTGDHIYFSTEQGTVKTECIVGGIFSYSDGRTDYILTPECEQRILHENSLSELYFVTCKTNEYNDCYSLMHELERAGYNSSSALYSYIHEQVDSIYVMSRGLLSMSIILIIALIAIFFSFFTVIIIRRNSFISLLIHHGMRLKRIVFLYWLILETMHLFIAIISFPVALKLCKWISTEYSLTFNIEFRSISIDALCVMTVFIAIFILITVSMMFFSRKLTKLNHQITSLKGNVV